MTKADVEMLINENKQLKIELQKLKSKSDFYTEFSNVDNMVTEKEDNDGTLTPLKKRVKNMSLDLNSVKSYDLNSYVINK